MRTDDPSIAPTILSDSTTVIAESGPEIDEDDVDASTLLGGRFEIAGLVGSGGMGTVYRARDRELDEDVALKMLKGRKVGLEALERFRREVKLARKVTHKNVARVFEFGEHEGRRFFTMELIDGESLRSRLTRSRTLSSREALEVGLAICDGLGAAHDVGVVHRDLKPDNVLISKAGRVAITDFGIAVPFDADGGRATAAFIGTPDYMAPEQVDGSITPDARTDIYAFGAMMFELVAGRVPFSGPTPIAVAAARLMRDAPRLAELVHDAPEALTDLIQKCLARRPEDRFRTAAELQNALEGVAQTEGWQGVAPAPSIPPISHQRPTGGRLTLAVLPFSEGGLEGVEYLASGLTEDLIDSLATSRAIRVIAHAASRGTAEQQDPRTIARDLGVDLVVYGALRKLGAEELGITVRMVGVADGIQIWSQRFAAMPAEFLKVNDEIARAVLRAVPGSTVPKETDLGDPIAIDLYLRARSRYRDFWYESSSDAEQLYARALEHAPNSPLLIAGRALVLARCAFFDSTKLPEARVAAQLGVELAPELGEALVAAGAVALQEGMILPAYQHATKAIARAPSLHEAHLLLGRVLSETGPLVEAERAFRTAIELDPRTVNSARELSRVHALLGRWDLVDRALENMSDGMDSVSRAIVRLRFSLWTRRRANFDGIRDELRAMRPMVQRAAPGFMSFLDTLVGTTPDASGITNFIDSVLQTAGSERRALFLHQLAAEAYASLGQVELAFEMLQKANDLPLLDLMWFEHCPAIDGLRKDPRFAGHHAKVRARVQSVLDLQAATPLRFRTAVGADR